MPRSSASYFVWAVRRYYPFLWKRFAADVMQESHVLGGDSPTKAAYRMAKAYGYRQTSGGEWVRTESLYGDSAVPFLMETRGYPLPLSLDERKERRVAYKRNWRKLGVAKSLPGGVTYASIPEEASRELLACGDSQGRP